LQRSMSKKSYMKEENLLKISTTSIKISQLFGEDYD